MRYLKQNTATVITVGPFLDATDGKTPKVALTATNEHVTFVVDNAGTPTLALDVNATASGGTTDMVHITNDDAGYYSLELTAAATNYVGGALLSVNYVTDHLPVFHEFTILPANVYDSLIPGTDLLDISVVQIAGVAVSTSTAQLGVNMVSTATDAITATSIAANAIGSAEIADGAITAAKIATDAIDADALAADALTEIFTKLATTAFTEAYSTKGAAVTLANFVYEVLAQLQEASTGGTTTETLKKRDQATTAATFTLNSATAPTSITRAT